MWLIVAIFASLVSATLEVIAFMWIPIIVSVAFSGPRITAALTAWGGALALTVGWKAALYGEPYYWVRQATMVLMAGFAIYLSAMIARQRHDLRALALTDPLTGLANRRLILERLNYMLGLRSRDSSIAVLSIDLDGFKSVNTRFGHAGGDEVLNEVGRRLERSMRSGDTIARFGGDEFIALCVGFDTEDDVERLCARIIDTINEPLPTPISTSIGATIGAVIIPPTHITDADAVVDQADHILMQQKASQRNAFEIMHVSDNLDS